MGAHMGPLVPPKRQKTENDLILFETIEILCENVQGYHAKLHPKVGFSLN